MFVSNWKESAKKMNSALLSGAKEKDKRWQAEKLIHRKFHLNMKNCFSLEATVHCSRLPREVVESPSQGIFKNGLDAILCNVFSADPA